MRIKLKRIYEQPTPQDGLRVLVERLWPRGISKDQAQINLWLKEAAPSTSLRKWFSHDSEKWKEFKVRYFVELSQNKSLLEEILNRAKKEQVTFVFASKEERYNNAVALKEFIERQQSKRIR